MSTGYPAHWEADVVLTDGGTLHLRPILPGDADRLVAFYSRLSAETIRYPVLRSACRGCRPAEV